MLTLITYLGLLVVGTVTAAVIYLTLIKTELI